MFGISYRVAATSVQPVLPYVAGAVRFNSDRLHTAGVDLSPNADGKLGLMSWWFKRKGGIGATRFIWHSDGGIFQMRSLSTNLINISSNNGLNLLTTTTITDTTTWHHLIASWDRGNGLAHIYVDDVDDITISSNTDAVVDYTRFGHAIGSLESVKANNWDAEVADFYYNNQEFLDLSVVANRRKFLNAAGKPVFLGSDGALPTGSQPRVFFSGEAAVWNAGTNLGSSQNFSMDGAVTAAANSPSS